MTAPDNPGAGPYGYQPVPGVASPRPAVPAPPAPPPPAMPAPPAPPPPVPPGPGVRPPFAAPPRRTEAGKLALWLVVGGFVVLLCLVGGGIGVVGSLNAALGTTNREAQATARQYLTALSEQRYGDAYGMLCQPARRDVTEQRFTDAERQRGPIVRFSLSTITFVQNRVAVPARIERDNGASEQVGLVMTRERVGGSRQDADAEYEFRVCGVVELATPAPS